MEHAPPTPQPIDKGLAALFAVEHLPMLRMATLMVGSASVAEEVVQDSFAVVAERWDSLERPGGYLRTTVVHGCAQVLRRRATENRAAEDRANRWVATESAVELPIRPHTLMGHRPHLWVRDGLRSAHVPLVEDQAPLVEDQAPPA